VRQILPLGDHGFSLDRAVLILAMEDAGHTSSHNA
jgi:hypothetical protein